MSKLEQQYDWIIVGGGIAGISIAEILCREGKSVLLLEKNKQLASETSKVFHEWMHSGTLYTLAPDKLLTLRYLLGATDDLIEYYSSYTNMNLVPTEKGVCVKDNGWFNNHNIEYHYRLHKFNPPWMMMVSKSIELINMVSQHDWLRRKAGAEYGQSIVKMKHLFRNMPKQLKSDEKFLPVVSPDITMNSRRLISDLLEYSLHRGLTVKEDSEVIDINDSDGHVVVSTCDNKYTANNVVLCSPELISKIQGLKVRTSYAPIAIVDGLTEEQSSFVELDYNVRKCINLLSKGNGVGQAGGISLSNESDVDSYIKYVIAEHKKRTPNMKVVDTYVGLKKELIQKKEQRNYLYHINKTSSNVWSVILGKFSLAFSMAPEFYRRVYHENPSKTIGSINFTEKNELISETSWQEIIRINNR